MHRVPEISGGPKRLLSLFACLLLLTALLMTAGPVAQATHGSRTLEVVREVTASGTNATVTLTARLSSAAADTVHIDFEVEGGVSNIDGDTRESPDDQCTIPSGSTTCGVTISSTAGGTMLVRGWIDHDQGGPVTEADSAEGRYSGVYTIPSSPPSVGDCTPDDPSTQDGSCPENMATPGAAEPDDTDVVEINWTLTVTVPIPAKLDCDPETSTVPASGAGSSQTYQCKVTDASDVPIQGANIDMENMDGANDSDNGTGTTADVNNFCTTNASGECSGSVSPSLNETGPADLCFWVDPDNDSTYGTAVEDGGECAAAEAVAETENNDTTDKVTLTWGISATPPSVDHVHLWKAGTESPDCETGVALHSENVPSSVTVVACVHSSSDEFISGESVTFTESGPATPNSGTVTTDAEGKATFTFRSSQAGNSQMTAISDGVGSNVFTASWHESWASQGGFLNGGPDSSSWADGRLDVFVRGGDNGLWHKSYEGGWSGWEGLGGVITSDPSAVSWDTNRIDIFARGGDNALWHMYWNGGWSGWESLGGSITSAPDASSQSPGTLDVFARGADNGVWKISWTGSGWTGWGSIGGQVTSDPGAVSWGSGRIDVFARGGDNALWKNSFSGGSWSGWTTLGGILTSGPDASSWAEGRIDVVVRGGDDAYWHNWFDGTTWSGWETLNGKLTSDPGAAAWTDRIHVMGRGNDGALWVKNYPAPSA